MAGKSRGHAHKFTIGDESAVIELLRRITAPSGSSSVDEKKLLRALDSAAQQYKQSQQKVRQAFFHGLLTGYAVGLKHR
jgi:hypothetical protein